MMADRVFTTKIMPGHITEGHPPASLMPVSTPGGLLIIFTWVAPIIGRGQGCTTARIFTRIISLYCIHPGTGNRAIGMEVTMPGTIPGGTMGTGGIGAHRTAETMVAMSETVTGFPATGHMYYHPDPTKTCVESR